MELDNAKTRTERTKKFMEFARSKGDLEFNYLHAVLCADHGWACDFDSDYPAEAAWKNIFDTQMIAKRMDEIIDKIKNKYALED